MVDETAATDTEIDEASLEVYWGPHTHAFLRFRRQTTRNSFSLCGLLVHGLFAVTAFVMRRLTLFAGTVRVSGFSGKKNRSFFAALHCREQQPNLSKFCLHRPSSTWILIQFS
jgi:hypothetical protein